MFKNFIKVVCLIAVYCLINIPAQAEYESSSASPSYNADKWTYYSDVYGFKQHDRWGLADEYGVRCSARFTEIEALDNNFIKVSTGYSRYGLIDKYCNIVIPIEYNSIEKNCYDNIIARNNDRYSAYNSNGKPLFYGEYYDLDQISKDYFRYKDGYYYGVINKYGQQVLLPQYEFVDHLIEDIFSVQQNALFGVVSADGTEICGPYYDSISLFSDYLFNIEIGGYHGLMTKIGTVLVTPQYKKMQRLSDTFYTATKDNSNYVFDITGKQLFSNNYKSIYLYDKTFFKVETSDKKLGIVDKTGKSITNGAIYDKLEKAKDNYIKVKKDGKWGAYNLAGKEVLPCIYGPLKINSMIKNLPADTEHTQQFRTAEQAQKVLMAYLYYQSGYYSYARNDLNEYYKMRITDTETSNLAQSLTSQLYQLGYIVTK